MNPKFPLSLIDEFYPKLLHKLLSFLDEGQQLKKNVFTDKENNEFEHSFENSTELMHLSVGIEHCISAVNEHFDYYISQNDKSLLSIKNRRDNLSKIILPVLDYFNSEFKKIPLGKMNETGKNIHNIIIRTGSLLKLIDKRIADYESVQNDNEQGLPSFIPKQENIKVMLMYELGIFDHLKDKYNDPNPSKLAQIIESFTGINKDTIRQTYREIIRDRTNNPNPFDDPQKKTAVAEILSGLKIVKKGNP